jgi:hypothetical protein
MKKIFALILLALSITVFADEPSVKYQCKSGFKSFSLHGKARFDTCPINNSTMKVDIVSSGGNYHTCWWPVTVTENNGMYIAKESDCEVNFSITGNELNAKFTGACRYFCGARAGFRNGSYTEKTSNK